MGLKDIIMKTGRFAGKELNPVRDMDFRREYDDDRTPSAAGIRKEVAEFGVRCAWHCFRGDVYGQVLGTLAGAAYATATGAGLAETVEAFRMTGGKVGSVLGMFQFAARYSNGFGLIPGEGYAERAYHKALSEEQAPSD